MHNDNDMERARAALSYLNPNADRDTWVKYGMCVKHEFGEAGFDVWDEWSSSGENYRAADAKSVWKSIGADGKRTIATLFFDAKQSGWKDTSARKIPTKAEIEARRAASAERARQAAEQEAVQHAAVAERAREIWEAAKPADGHPYLERKCVKSYGLRIGRWEIVRESTGEVVVVSDNALLVPIRDRQRNVWSLQAIFPSDKNALRRDKDYLSGGAKAGHFFSVGGKPLQRDGRPVFVLGEGYATCASVHACTGHLVLVCFDTSNLARVAKTLRDAQPGAVIIFAADNDTQTTGNPGVTIARKAAMEVGGLVAVPDPGDFNDMHLAAGSDAVRDAIEAAASPADPETEPPPPEDPPPWDDAPEDLPVELAAPLPGPVDDDDDARPENNKHFAVLGYNRDHYYFFSFGKRQILEYTASQMGESGLIHLAELSWWEMNFPGERTKVDTKAASNFLVRTAEKRGIYDQDKIRGRGAWIDEGRVVYHHGSHLSVGDDTMDVTRIKSQYVYELAPSMPTPADTMLSDADGARMIEVMKMFRWSVSGSALLFAGWVALAPVCGAIPWRPHIWMTGGAGSGKSSLAKFGHSLLKGTDVFAQGNSSEAGIRQRLRADARPVIMDESESNEEGDAKRVQSILGLIRQASTESDAETLKGTTDGSGMTYHIRSMFCLASIQVALKHKADIDRLTVLSLRSGKADDAGSGSDWARIKDAMYRLTDHDPMVRAQLLRRCIDLLPTTLQNIEVFSRVGADVFGSQRDGDQYGALLAGAWSLMSTKLATPQDARALFDAHNWSELRDNNDADESQRALQALMGAHVRVKGGVELTVYELVKAASGQETGITEINEVTADAILQRYGMRVKAGYLMLANGSNELKRLMAGTSFEADYRGVLLRVEGADKNNNRVERFNGVAPKCIRIPLGPIVNDKAAPAEPAF